MAFYALLVYFATSMGTHATAAHQVSFTLPCILQLFLCCLSAHFLNTKLTIIDNSTLMLGHGSDLYVVHSMWWTYLPNCSIIYAWVDVRSKSEFGKGWCYSFTNFKRSLLQPHIYSIGFRALSCAQLNYTLCRWIFFLFGLRGSFKQWADVFLTMFSIHWYVYSKVPWIYIIYWQARSLLRSLLTIGAILGLLFGIVGTFVPWLFPYTFTPDQMVIQEVSFWFFKLQKFPLSPLSTLRGQDNQWKYRGFYEINRFEIKAYVSGG
jgi:hypothetical protein